MRPGAGEGWGVGDAGRMREVEGRRGYLLMRSGNATFVTATSSPPSLHFPPSFSQCVLSSHMDMEPKVFWQSAALYRGQEATQGPSRALRVRPCLCFCVFPHRRLCLSPFRSSLRRECRLAGGQFFKRLFEHSSDPFT